MRSKLLVSTAALLAGMAMASAQNVPSGGRDSGPAAQSQPTRFQLVINMRTAKAVSSIRAADFLARADEVIE
jgi:hypothetical protein